MFCHCIRLSEYLAVQVDSGKARERGEAVGGHASPLGGRAASSFGLRPPELETLTLRMLFILQARALSASSPTGKCEGNQVLRWCCAQEEKIRGWVNNVWDHKSSLCPTLALVPSLLSFRLHFVSPAVALVFPVLPAIPAALGCNLQFGLI